MTISVSARPLPAPASEVGAAVFSRVSPSVFVIRAHTPSGTVQGSGVAFRHGYSLNKGKPERVIATSTWIATNAHVVLGSTSILVESAGTSRPASVAYADAELDIALIEVEGEVLPVTKVFDAQQAAIGSRVFAIGSPLGLENTISEGLLSGVRELKGTRAIQTSAAISKGNSGGGLFDAQARLLGITTFKLKGGENLNFAVDSRYITAIDDALAASKSIRARYDRKVVRPGDENDLDERYLDSPALARWLLEQKAPDGSPLYTSVNRVIHPDKFFVVNVIKHDKELYSILENFLKGRPRSLRSSPSLLPEGAAIAAYRLACPTYLSFDGSSRRDRNLTIDPSTSQVNGHPATFTESTITFMVGSSTYRLDRYSGQLSISSENFPSLRTGTCTKFAERQF